MLYCAIYVPRFGRNGGMESCELGRYRGTTRCETSSEAGGEGYVTGLCVLHAFQIDCNNNFSISLHGHAEKRTFDSLEILQ